MAIIGENTNLVDLYDRVMADWEPKVAAFVTAQMQEYPNAAAFLCKAIQWAPDVFRVTEVGAGLHDLAQNLGLGGEVLELGHQVQGVAEMAVPLDFVSADLIEKGLDNLAEANALNKDDNTPEVVIEPAPEPAPSSSIIGGQEVDAQINEIKEKQTEHETVLNDLYTARDIELTNQAVKDDQRAEWMASQTDLSQEGLKTLEDAKAANQQAIVTRYEAEEATLMQQQSWEMAALVATQTEQPPPAPPLPVQEERIQGT